MRKGTSMGGFRVWGWGDSGCGAGGVFQVWGWELWGWGEEDRHPLKGRRGAGRAVESVKGVGVLVGGRGTRRRPPHRSEQAQTPQSVGAG